MSTEYVAAVEDIKDGEHIIVNVQGRSIGVYRINGQFYALHNYCPHAGAPLCKGQVVGTTLPSNVYEYEYGRQQEIVRCPWHGWEFDVKTGKSLVNEKVRAKSYMVIVEEGKIGIVL